MDSTTPERNYEANLCKTFNLVGWKDESIWEHDSSETLPAHLTEVNFAQMKLTESLMEWKDSVQNPSPHGAHKGTERDDGEKVRNSGATNLSKKEVVRHAVKTLLSEYCANEKGIEEAGELLADIDGLALAADILEATDPLKWPARALAQLTIKVVQNIILPYGLDDGTGDSSVSSLFQHERDVESHVRKVMQTGQSLIGGKIEECLKTYFSTTIDDGGSAPSVADIRTASKLLVFSDADDKETMLSVLKVLGPSRMPAAAIAQSVSKIIAENASEFQKTIQDDLRKRFTFRYVLSPQSISI
ncbi:hypothetical protein NMY22_g19351 [Coprinellus aureogranulatus]|nr:hypothetical protein NMY22_g19351 [Coprinellus aureogranulatus]